MSVFAEEQLVVALGCGDGPSLGYELPVVETLRVDVSAQLDVVEHIEA